VSEAEHLDFGADRVADPRRRLWRVLLVVAVVVAGSAVVVDRVLRAREADRVAACAKDVGAAVQFEGRRVRATYEYVRFAAGLVDTRGQMGTLYLQIAKAARRSGSRFAEARDLCASIAVLPNHDDLRDRRDECIRVLDTQRSRLSAVAADGRSVSEWLDAPRTC
jgi:hypothetical protein